MVSNKNKKIYGFKFISLLLAVIALGGWLVSTSIIAERTEQNIRTFLAQQTSQPSSSYYLELISYKRSLFKAELITRLRSKDPLLANVVSGVTFRTDIKHGPVIFNEHNLQLAMASLNMSMDKAQLSEDANDLLARLFGNKEPFSASVLVDYDLQGFYRLDSTSFEYEVADMKVSVSEGSAEGVYDSSVNAMPINFAIDEIVFKQGDDSLESMRNNFVFNLLNGSQSSSKREFTSTIAMTRESNFTGLSINLENLQLDQLANIVTQYEDRYNLDQQIEWTLEDAMQSQEAQDRLHELFREQDDEVLPETDLLVSQLLKQGSADISFLHKVDNQDRGLAYNDSVE
ncbi:MAG: DUF945 family protein [Thiotrichaceae bacterium]